MVANPKLSIDLDPQVKEDLIRSLALIRLPTSGFNANCGTGFFIDTGLLVTTRHFFYQNNPDTTRLRIYTYDGKYSYKGVLIAESEDYDIAIIRSNVTDHSILEIDHREPRKNEEIYVIGYPGRQPLHDLLEERKDLSSPMPLKTLPHFLVDDQAILRIAYGIIKYPNELRPSPNMILPLVFMTYLLKAPIGGGVSGGPILSADWKVIGICTNYSNEVFVSALKAYGVSVQPHLNRLLDRYYKSLESNE